MARPELNDCAVVFCCDRKFYPLALFMIRQIDFHNPGRKFDFVIASREPLEAPDWAQALGIVFHRSGDLPDHVDLKSYAGSTVPLYRLPLPRELGSRYRRLLYIDSDMFVEGGDLNRLFAMDIGPHPLGAVLDAPYLYDEGHRAREYVRLNWPALPYFNAGLLLIDTARYVDQEVDLRAFDACRTHPQALVYADQSIINIALKGKFAELAPCWNWQTAGRLPLMSLSYPVFVWHFIGRRKPDRDVPNLLDARFAEAYRDFAARFMPEFLQQLPQRKTLDPLGFGQLVKVGMQHMAARKVSARLLARYPDPYLARV